MTTLKWIFNWITAIFDAKKTVANAALCKLFIGGYKRYSILRVTLSLNIQMFFLRKHIKGNLHKNNYHTNRKLVTSRLLKQREFL